MINLRPVVMWGVLWRSNNQLDGRTEYLIRDYDDGNLVLFRSCRDTRVWIEAHYGHLRTRPDLQREPFGWKMPIPVRVEMRVLLRRKK